MTPDVLHLVLPTVTMCYMKQINLRLPEELLVQVDERRGDIPRERWLRTLVEAELTGPPPIDDPIRLTVPEKPPAQPKPQPAPNPPQTPPPPPKPIVEAQCPHPSARREKHGGRTLCRACMGWLS